MDCCAECCECVNVLLYVCSWYEQSYQNKIKMLDYALSIDDDMINTTSCFKDRNALDLNVRYNNNYNITKYLIEKIRLDNEMIYKCMKKIIFSDLSTNNINKLHVLLTFIPFVLSHRRRILH